MSNGRDPKGTGEGQKPTVPPAYSGGGSPPAFFDVDDDRTAVANVPEELIAESLRGPGVDTDAHGPIGGPVDEDTGAPPARGRPGARRELPLDQTRPADVDELGRERPVHPGAGAPRPGAGAVIDDPSTPDAGLRQMFSRDPAAIREHLPTDAEGDALLESLFPDSETVDQPPRSRPPRLVGPPGSSTAPLPGARPPGPPRAPPRAGGIANPPTPPLPPSSMSAPRPAAGAPPPPTAPRPRLSGQAPPMRVAVGPAPGTPAAPSSAARPPVATTVSRALPAPRAAPAPTPPAAEAAPPRIELPTIDPDALDEVSDVETQALRASEVSIVDAVEAQPVARASADSDDHTEQVSASDLEPDFDGGPRRTDIGSEPEFAEPEITNDPTIADGETLPLSGPMPSRPPPRESFDDERDASTALVEAGRRDEWASRATWLRAEAGFLEDRAARARGLVVASELMAMVGEERAAAEVAREARTLGPSSPILARQVRGLAMRDGNWGAALEALEQETKVAPSPAARCHGALLAAAVQHRHGQADAAPRSLDFAARAVPADPRVYVRRMAEAMAQSDTSRAAPALAKLRMPDAAELERLAEAGAQLAAELSPQPHRVDRPAASPHDALVRARSALDAGDIAATLRELTALGGASGLGQGIGWLRAALAAPRRATRPQAAAALKQLVGGPHGAYACRALAARAIETGDPAAAAAATEAAAPGAFTTADRIALAALSTPVAGPDGRPSGDGAVSADDVQSWIQASIQDDDLAPLTAAVSGALTALGDPERRVMHVGPPRGRAAVSLGRVLAAVPPDSGAPGGLMGNETLVAAVHDYAELAPGGVAQALSLELDVDAGAVARVAHAISNWSSAEAANECDRALAGALLAEAAGEHERALVDLDRARLADPGHEGAARARASHADQATAARVLAAHAEALAPGDRAAVLLTEAAVRIADVDASEEADPLLKRAAEMAPKLPLAVHLGERAARARGDRDGLVEWLRRRRESSEDAIEQAQDLVREALLLSDGEGAPAAGLLEQALLARPRDVGLRELYERLATEAPADFATWRDERAREATARAGGPDGEAARLALEAALDFERTGDLARAAAAARHAMEAGDTVLAPVAAYRAALAGYGTGDLIDALLPRAREATDPVDRLEVYERLADLDEIGRRDSASGLLWRRTILEETPNHLPTLRRVATALMESGRDDDLEPIALEIARALDGPEATAHAMVSARLRLRNLGWDDTREPVEIAYRQQPRGPWALRQMSAHARARGDHATAVEADRQLIERTDRPAEAATLALRAAESASAVGDVGTARALLLSAVESVPRHPTAHGILARILEGENDPAAAAGAWEAAAAATNVRAERIHDLYRAQALWLDGAKDMTRARAVLETIADDDPSYQDVFQRLQSIYIAEGARSELAALLRRRLDATTDPAERVEMEVLRGRALAEVGEPAAAKHALAAALEQNPDHVEALGAFADLASAEGDYPSAEQAWIRLARLVADPVRQATIYLRLGELYDSHLPQPERAELAYREILKRSADDPEQADAARERLVGLYCKANDVTRALEEQTLLITGAQTPELKCRRTTELAAIYEGAGDLKKAEATLLNARKTWPKDEVALAALVRFYQRSSQAPAAQVLLDRAIADARRALGTGRFEPFLFSTVATVAELRGRPDDARVAAATVAALEGREVALEGGGNHAGDPRLDDLLAPEVMTPAFRELLLKTGALLDAAVPFDVTALRAMPLPAENADIGEHIRLVAQAYGLGQVNVWVSSALGPVCIAAGAHPPTLVVGQQWLTTPRADIRTFLLHRALKVLQSNTAALSRTAPIDLWPLLAAYLKAFTPQWAPTGVDGAKLTDAYGRIARAMQGLRVDPQVRILASEVIGSIGNRASTLNTVVNGWGDRAGLLALGDPNVAITGVAWAGGHVNQPPASGKERLTWIGRNAEARELVVFAVSDAYSDARQRLGLSRR